MNRLTWATVQLTTLAGVLLIGGCGGTGSTGTPAATAASTPATSAAHPTTSPVSPASSDAPSTPASTVAPSTQSSAHLTESNPPGDIPDTQVFVPYSPAGAHFKVTVPEGWARTTSGDTVTFTDKLNMITLREVPAATPPSEATVTAVAVPQLQRQIPAFASSKVTTVTRTAGPAVLVTFLGDSAPDPVTNRVVRDAFERYAFWHAGREVIVTLSGPVGADNVDPWKTVTDSLRWT